MYPAKGPGLERERARVSFENVAVALPLGASRLRSERVYSLDPVSETDSIFGRSSSKIKNDTQDDHCA